MKRKILLVAAIAILAAFAGGFTYAAFVDHASFEGALITVGSADLKLYDDLAKSPNDPGNLVDSKPSPQFLDITPSFSQDYLVKLYNNSTKPFVLLSNANYTTAEDPEDLRRYLEVEFYFWSDNNNNGTLEEGELGTSLGKKNVIDWKSDGFELNTVNPNDTQSFVMRFTSESIPESKMGKTGLFSFEFSTLGQ